uniref:TF-B3 domain-containing protein n=2 Tax=Brassica campestris TaxID=3711 RepID=M4DYR6_BRACM
MVTHDDDKLSEGEKKCFDLFATLLLAFGDDELRARQQGQDRNLLMIHTAATTLLSGKRKIDDAQENTLVPIRAQPIREIKTPVREINRPVKRKAPVRREPVVTPGWVIKLMKTFKGREGDAKMIFEKAMTKTDLATNQGRLLMPFNQMAEMDFLNEAELKILEEHHKGDYVKKGVDVVLLDRSGKKRWNLNMRIWKMSTCFNYALCAGWNQVVLDNDFQRNQTITLWSFHSLDGTLYFAFDPPTPALSLVVISESEDPFVCEEANRRLYPFPKRRTTLRVCVPPPTSDSSNLRL